ncbi:MAG: CoxG family protein [Candidatus Acidiferrales bacterium]
MAVDVDQDTAFKFLEVPEQLAMCIPGCHNLRQIGPTSFTAVLTDQISFMTLSFQVQVEIVKIDPPNSIEARVTGKPIGFVGQLVATASLKILDAGPGQAIIRHSSDIALTGKLGGLGQPVFRAKSSEMAKKFGANLKAALEGNAPGAKAAGERRA